MTLLKTWFLAFAGFTSGGVIAAGIFAFLAMIGVFPRVISRTKTRRHIMLYETLLICGGAFGNALDLMEFPIPVGRIPLAGETAGQPFNDSGWAWIRRVCRMPRHVPGGNGKGGSCPEQAPSPVGGHSVYDSGHCPGENGWGPCSVLPVFPGLRFRQRRRGAGKDASRDSGTE